mmetsp:Transcript_9360/g.27477  ORF Transcript_9360/g.27477 Transcript_9360/m.27477 type:complete len:472 (-) Transcript_9360:357-1772(-)
MALRGVLAAALAAAALGATVNTEVTRVIDATGPVVRARADIIVSGVTGGKYEYLVPAPACDHLAFIFAKELKRDELDSSRSRSLSLRSKDDELEVVKGKRTEDGQYYTVMTRASGDLALRVRTVFTRRLRPLPEAIAQKDKQFVVLEDSHYFLSPYATSSQRTTVKLGTPVRNVVDYTELAPTSTKMESLVFGPYEDVEAMASSPLRVHYQNHAPFATFTNVLREIEVSHWGNIAVEEHFDLEHSGARLQGEFSRFEYAKQRYGKESASFHRLTARLPQDAWGVYYRDRIGNISQSKLDYQEDEVVMEIEPRYPMFGGWKIFFYQGYNIPSDAALSVIDGERYLLDMSFGVPYESISSDAIEVKVILPEGAYDVEVDVPFDVEMESDRRFTYLDTRFMGGRPVMIMKKKNVVKDHNVPFTVSYKMRPFSMLIDVAILIAAYLGIYVAVMLLLRVNLTLEDASSGSKKLKKA